MLILVCNVGSTSLKYKLFNMPDETILVEAKTERVGRTDAIFTYRNHCSGYSEKLENLDIPNYAAGIRLFLRYLLGEESGYCREITELEAIGFKTVLAKGYYGVHELTEEVLQAMEAYNEVAPAHNPPYIQAIRVFREILPDRLMVGCFETAFHQTIPLSRRLYAVPYEWYEQYGIQRFGYHGASHGYIARQIAAKAGETYKLISCHLGGSGSLCAIENGKSVDTSFGFSLQTGIPHANRSGDLDAYIIPFLLSRGMPMDEILRGIDKNGGLAYCGAIVKYIGAFYAELGGLDYLVFTGGIGENSAPVREKVCSALAHLGIAFDPARNASARGEALLSAEHSRVKVHVIPTNEEVGIAQTIYERSKP